MSLEDRGFTLVELMIVVAVIGVLAAVTMPLGNHWMQRAKLTSVGSELSLAVGKAVGTALRNRYATTMGTPVTAVCISPERVVSVLEGDALNAPSCAGGTGVALWSATLDEDVQITSAGSEIDCLCFDSAALLTTSQCAGCLAQSTFDLSVGDRTEHAFVY